MAWSRMNQPRSSINSHMISRKEGDFKGIPTLSEGMSRDRALQLGDRDLQSFVQFALHVIEYARITRAFERVDCGFCEWAGRHGASLKTGSR